MKKQTSANNEFLAQVKKVWNAKIYKKASELVNTQGVEAARQYVQQFQRSPLGY